MRKEKTMNVTFSPTYSVSMVLAMLIVTFMLGMMNSTDSRKRW